MIRFTPEPWTCRASRASSLALKLRPGARAVKNRPAYSKPPRARQAPRMRSAYSAKRGAGWSSSIPYMRRRPRVPAPRPRVKRPPRVSASTAAPAAACSGERGKV